MNRLLMALLLTVCLPFMAQATSTPDFILDVGKSVGDAVSQRSKLRMFDGDTASPREWIRIQPPADLAASWDLTLPGDDGTPGQYLQTNGSGVTSWQTIAAGAPIDATYVTNTPNATLTNEQALSTLSSGYAKVTTGTGLVSTTATIPTADVTGDMEQWFLAGSSGSQQIVDGETATIAAGTGILSTPASADTVTINTAWTRSGTTIEPATADDQLRVSSTNVDGFYGGIIEANATGAATVAVVGEHQTGTGGAGVRGKGEAASGVGVWGQATTDASYGGFFTASGSSNDSASGVYAESAEPSGYGLIAASLSNDYAIKSHGAIEIAEFDVAGGGSDQQSEISNPPADSLGLYKIGPIGYLRDEFGTTRTLGLESQSRKRHMQYLSNVGAATWTNAGFSAAPATAGTLTNADDADGQLIQFATSTTVDTDATIFSPATATRRDWEPEGSWRFKTGSNSTNVRWVAGFFNVIPVVDVNPATVTAGFGAWFHYDSAAHGDLVWRCVTSDGVGGANVQAVAAGTTGIANNRAFDMRIEMNDSRVLFYINNDLVATSTTDLPAATAAMGIGAGVRVITSGGSAKQMKVGRFSLAHQ